MVKRKIHRFIGLLLVFALCFSLLPLTSFAGDKGNENATDNLTPTSKEKGRSGTFGQPGQVHWYKVIPNEVSKSTHVELTVSSDAALNVTVYPSKERASEDDTFDQYRGITSPDQPVKVDFPYAWEGPYYIKVEYLSDEESEKQATSDGETNTKPAYYQIHYKAVTLPPSDPEDEACPVELSTSQKKYGSGIIKQLRQIRDGLLSKTDKGKEMTSLYYKSSPFLVAKMIFNKSVKESVYHDLVQLKPIFGELAENGANTSHQLTKEDQQAINDLYEITMKSVPASLKGKISRIAREAGLSKLAGKPVANVLRDTDLYPANSDANKLIIKMKKGKSLKSLSTKVAAYGVKSKSVSALKTSSTSFKDMYVAKADNQSPNTLAKKLNKLPDVEFAEPVKQYHVLSQDVQYPYQWSLNNTGQEGGKHGADVKNTPLQSLVNQRNLKQPLIAVVDTGVDSSLADLKGNVRTDKGKNFIARNSDANDDEGHGTHVSGIIAATADNGYSMSGLNAKAKILPVKVLDASGEGDTDQIALGIKYAVDQGAKVINLSLGGDYSRTIEYVLKYAASKNVTIVAASGNDFMDEISYPASSRYTIAVGATNRLDLVADYSDYGEGLDLVAPGSDIPSLLPNGNVTYMSGTSMAVPHVAAVAGLLLSENSNLKPNDIKKILTETADDVAFKETDNRYGDECYDEEDDPVPCKKIPGYDPVSGWGRLNAFSAVSAVDLNVKVNTIKDNQNIVTGTAKKGTLIQVKKGKQLLGTSKAASNGKFTVKINKVQKAGSVLRVAGSDAKGSAKTSIKAIVKKGTPPPAPKVNSVSNKSTTVTGKTLADLKVKVKNKSKKVIASRKADGKGAFKVKIKKQKAGTTLYVTVTDLANRESKPAKIVVKDKIPPRAPNVSKVTNRDTVVKGKTEAYATVTVKHKGKKIGSKKADRKGHFKVKIKKQKAGSVLYVTSKDKAGNTSKATKVKVKKYKKK